MQLPELYRSAPLWVVVSELCTVLCKRYYIFKKEKKEEWMTVVTTILQLHMHYPFMGATISYTLPLNEYSYQSYTDLLLYGCK